MTPWPTSFGYTMGSGASSASGSINNENISSISEYTVKELPEQIEHTIYIDEKFPLIIDPTNKARLFLKYQLGSFIKHTEFHQLNLNRALVGALIHGRTLTISFEDLKGISYEFFEPNYFPREILSRSDFFKDGIWQSVFHTSEGDPSPDDVTPSPEFVFILCTTSEYIPPDLLNIMRVIKIVDKETEQPAKGNDSTLDEIAHLYGAAEIIRFFSLCLSNCSLEIALHLWNQGSMAIFHSFKTFSRKDIIWNLLMEESIQLYQKQLVKDMFQ